MRIFSSFKEMLSEVQRDVTELGIRKKSDSVQNVQDPGNLYEMKEIIGYSYKLEKWDDAPACFTVPEMRWLLHEFEERINKNGLSNPGKAWLYRKEVWEPFLNEEGRFDYTYSERIGNQLERVIEELQMRPNSRQAVVLIYREYDNLHWGGKMRVPCSLSYQFIISAEKVNLIYNMRSCDVFTHFKFDVMLACMLLGHVAKKLYRDEGVLTHNIGSLHGFRKDMQGVF